MYCAETMILTCRHSAERRKKKKKKTQSMCEEEGIGIGLGGLNRLHKPPLVESRHVKIRVACVRRNYRGGEHVGAIRVAYQR